MDQYNQDSIQPIPVELLNTMSSPGLCFHILRLKVNEPVILLRYIDVQVGLCNSTRLIVRALGADYLNLEPITCASQGKTILLVRIPLESIGEFKFTRTQLPVCLCYAATMHKSQGQTIQRLGMYLPEPVFVHGMLYVALSRVKSPRNLKICMLNVCHRFQR